MRVKERSESALLSKGCCPIIILAVVTAFFDGRSQCIAVVYLPTRCAFGVLDRLRGDATLRKPAARALTLARQCVQYFQAGEVTHDTL